MHTPSSNPQSAIRNPQSEVLLAEDSRTQAELLKSLLEESGYLVRHALNGRLALAAAREKKPALIVSDVLMPEMDGFDFCRAVKNDPALRDVPVILLTSLSDPQDIVRGLTAQADYYLTKPYDPAHLLGRIELLLAHPVKWTGEPQRLEVALGGQNVVIQSEPQQILNLLMATYEQAVQQNRALLKTQLELHELNEELEQRVAERTAAVREKEERLRAIFNATTDTVGLFARDGTILNINENTVERFGRSAAETIGSKLHDFLPPEVAASRMEKLEQVFRSGLPVRFEDERDGMFFENHLYPVRAADGTVTGVALYAKDITERKRVGAERERLIAELQKALAEVKALSGLLPICANCKKIRDGKNYWHRVESYIAAHTDATFTHSLCPDCIQKLYPDYAEDPAPPTP